MPNAPKRFKPAHVQRSRGQKSQGYQGWYQTPEWKAIRNAVLHRDSFLCQQCQRNGKVKAVREHTTHDDPDNQAHADHIEPHRGDWQKFIDIEGIETLCGKCHRRKTKQEQLGDK